MRALTFLAALLCASSALSAPPTAEDKYKESVAADIEKNWARPSAEEWQTVTAHDITAAGKHMNYHATGGTLTIRDDEGKPTGSVFYVAYTLDGEAGARRPITFLYNGGPGSASLWLHMGSFAPMRLQTNEPVNLGTSPYKIAANADTLLDKTDLVFIDMIGAGLSRPLGDTEAKTFWGVDQDADAFAKAIMRYATKNGRWNSPKFLFGESYGTLRSPVVANKLQEQGFALNGVILLSSILNYGIEQSGYDQSYIANLPSYAATAWYHKKMANPPVDVASAVQQARDFALGAYASALAKGSMISDAEAESVAKQMSALTGLSADYIRRANLRVDLYRFQKELLREKKITIGRFDSRYQGVDADSAGETPDYDPANVAISDAFVSTLNDYLTHDLNIKTTMHYRPNAYNLKGFTWDWKHNPPCNTCETQNNPNTGIDLGMAMRTNPKLQVLSLNGYYDMATPFFATEYDVAHIPLEAAQRANISFKYYPSGHMIYLNPQALHQLHIDLSAFYDKAAP
jgi:carboxypeptidase C (cathepsin A)